MPAAAQERRDLVGGGDGQRVDDAGARQVAAGGRPARPAGAPAPGRRQHRQVQRLAVERAAQDQRRLAAAAGGELLGDVGDDPGVGGGGGGQHRGAGRQLGEQRADAAVVGAEVVAPVGDAVRLVDDEQAGGRGQLGQDGVAEAGVVEPLGADQQHVDLAPGDRRRRPASQSSTLAELTVTARMPARCGGGDLVAHQRQQRADDDGRPGAAGPQQRGGDEVDGRLAPAGALHDQRPAPAASPARRSRSTGPRAARRPRRPARAGGARRRRARSSSWSSSARPCQTGPTGRVRPVDGWG